MSTSASPPTPTAFPSEPERRALTPEAVARWASTSPACAALVSFGLPALVLAGLLLAGASAVAAAAAAGFACATAYLLGRALFTFVGLLLKLLVASRAVLVIVVGLLLVATTGQAWVGVVSAVLLWLLADRLLGRRALRDVWKQTQP